jgi:hypothetical protein
MGIEMMQVMDPLVHFKSSAWGSFFLYLYCSVKFDAAAWHVTTVTVMLN